MEIQEHFDPSQIVKIKFVPERPASFCWEEAKPEIRTFFGLRIKQKATPSGFVDKNSLFPKFYSEDEIKRMGYLVYPWGEKINDRVCYKPYVTVYLKHEVGVIQYFETEKEASRWVESLKTKSGRDNFEIVSHKI
jgi:hypothetical protein